VSSLFTSQTPASGDNSDGTPGITTATTVRVTEAGEVSAVRFFSTVTVGGTYTGALYEVTNAAAGGTGTLLASEVAGAPPDSAAWNLITFDTPVTVEADTLYRVALHNTDGRYVVTGAFFTNPLSNAEIVADSNGDTSAGLGALAQGTFEINAALAFPNDTFNASCYFVDWVFTADGDVSPAPDGIAVTVALGAPTVTLNRTAAPDSVAVPVSLGAPFLSVSPDGITVGVSLGAPETEGAPPVRRGGWETYGDALKFNADQARYEQTRVPVDCPNDLEPLIAGPNGSLRCPFDGWSWPERRILDRP
jgi:hypothetical protein